MNQIVINVNNISKLYRLGEFGTGTISNDFNRWFAKVRGREDPFAMIGQVNNRNKKAESDYVWALKDINFHVNKGDVLGVIGKNGAGKSTLLKLLSRITTPSTGEIKIKGRIAALLEVGTGMHSEMTARENIFLNGAILGMSKQEIKAKFDEIVEFSGCALYIDTPIKRFSSGMRIRLGFAVAAFLEPEILIVDEVLAVGDAQFQRRAIGKMKEVSQSEGRTVLFVSHNMGSMRQLCTRGIILENGFIIFDGNINDAIGKHLEISVDNNDLLSYKSEKRDSKASILEVYATNHINEIRINFLTSEDIIIHINYFLEKGINNARIVLQFITFSGELAFATTYYCKSSKEESGSLVTAIIPKFLLNNTGYIIRIHIGIPGIEYLIHPIDVLKLYVETVGHHGSTYLEKWPGVLAPQIEWNEVNRMD